MSDRALTLATLGVLSGTALTLASLGLLQSTEPVVPPRVVFQADAGGFDRRVAELRHAELIRDDEDLLAILRAILESGVMDGHGSRMPRTAG